MSLTSILAADDGVGAEEEATVVLLDDPNAQPLLDENGAEILGD